MTKTTPKLREACRLIAGYRADFPVDTMWLHDKSGGLYWVQAHALNETDLTPCIVYRSKDTGTLWIRPAAEFADGRCVGPVGIDN